MSAAEWYEKLSDAVGAEKKARAEFVAMNREHNGKPPWGPLSARLLAWGEAARLCDEAERGWRKASGLLDPGEEEAHANHG